MSRIKLWWRRRFGKIESRYLTRQEVYGRAVAEARRELGYECIARNR